MPLCGVRGAPILFDGLSIPYVPSDNILWQRGYDTPVKVDDVVATLCAALFP